MTPPSPAGRRLALFDLDGTLLDGDTDELWCEFLVDEGLVDRERFLARNREVAEAYTRRAISPEDYSAFYASLLVGRTIAAWRPLRDRCVRERVAPRLGGAARALVERHREAGDRVVLTTAANRFLADAVAAELGIADVIATELVQAAGRYTGGVAGTPNMQGGKVERLRGWLADRSGMDERSDVASIDAAFRAATFYSDSSNDLPLLEAVGHPVAVDPDETLARIALARGWPVLGLAG